MTKTKSEIKMKIKSEIKTIKNIYKLQNTAQND